MGDGWYKNRRGEWYLVGQFVLLILVACGPRTARCLPEWGQAWQTAGTISGLLLMAFGFVLAVAGALNLGRNLTPFICPKAGSVLLQQGAYRLVRHPVYSGLLHLSFGWGLVRHGWLTLCYALLLAMVLNLKARREEQWLRELFPGYPAYCRRVRRFIPLPVRSAKG